MARVTLEKMQKAHRCDDLRKRVPEVAEVTPEEGLALWEKHMAGHTTWSKEKIFMAALGIALQLSRGK